ncbi:glutamate 5-kinase [Streptomyces sp. NRRL S-244]|uniref:glutamate 5-kinase n=1 Tax=Streptomyces sp. NRRL S-244 TaxID=1463897 RepID=UPI00068B97C4|nr:glutamate 5-kinase [Streptomyces sp. NRRL S-244]
MAEAHRIVVKIGSSSLTSDSGRLDPGRLAALVEVLAGLYRQGRSVVLVSSGAVAAGLAPLGLTARPAELSEQQAAASVGQGLLMGTYGAEFGRYGIQVGQVLLTAGDITRRDHYHNARRTLKKLMLMGIVPVVNENDVVATHEVRFGDNDRLAALVAELIGADLLVLLSDVEALYDGDPLSAGTSPIAEIRGPADLAGIRTGTPGRSGVGTGGMGAKVQAAMTAASAGIPVVLAAAWHAARALAGGDTGTYFHAARQRPAEQLFWLAHATAPQGRIVLDAEAVRDVREHGGSVLWSGVTAVEGQFTVGDPVDLADGAGRPVARGLARLASDDLVRLLAGFPVPEEGPGAVAYPEVVGAEDVALFAPHAYAYADADADTYAQTGTA